jgi:hypothetical protein
VPTEKARIVELVRDEKGRLAGRVAKRMGG